MRLAAARWRRLAVVALLWAATPAETAIIGTCTILVNQTGIMAPNAAIDRLGSGQGGGRRAQATVTASSLLCSILNLLDCYSIAAVAPSSFLSAPNGGDSNVAFTSVFSLDGGPDQPGGTPAKLVNGTHGVTVDLTAARTSGIYPAGAYQAQVVLRCE